MNDENHPLDADLSALLEGRLSPAAADGVRRQLDRESRLLEAEIRDSLQGHGGERLRLEPAPDDLRGRLRAIPGRTGLYFSATMKWGMALSIAVLMIAVPLVYRYVPTDAVPTPAEAAQARADLVVAFSYLQQVTNRSSRHLKSEIGQATQDAIVNGVLLGIRNDRNKG